MWCREPPRPDDICFFTDYHLHLADRTPARRKIAWLIEPPAICQRSYNYIRDHSTAFHYVLTYNREFVDDRKFLFCTSGGLHISPDSIGIHSKTKLISIISSGSRGTPPGYGLRHEAISRFGTRMDVMGSGYKPIEHKEAGLVDYMFSVAIENSAIDDYFTEKIIDCFAAGTVPIYWGTRNIGKYFDAGGILWFNTLDELDRILCHISPDLYRGMLRSVASNIECAKKYMVTEDYVYEQYPFLFS